MNGGTYIRGKAEMPLIAEVMEQLQLKAPLQCDGIIFLELFEKVDRLQLPMGNPKKNLENIIKQWNGCF